MEYFMRFIHEKCIVKQENRSDVKIYIYKNV